MRRKWHVMLVGRSSGVVAREWSRHWTASGAEHSVDRFMTTVAAIQLKAVIVHEDKMERFTA
jgi:hypothetical protein